MLIISATNRLKDRKSGVLDVSLRLTGWFGASWTFKMLWFKSLLQMGNPIQTTVDNVSSDLVSRIVIKLWKKLQKVYNRYMVPTPEHFINHTKECYASLSNIKCLSLNKVVLPLKQVYVPLTIMNSREDVVHRIEQYELDFFKKYRKIMIVDTAGMGKSTLVKKLFLDIVDEGYGIPIFIELRRLDKNNTIIKYILKQLSFFRRAFSQELLYSFIQDGDFIFLLDGYDEISLSDKKQVTEQLQDFISHARENRFILTSRHEAALSAFTDFESFSIVPLKRQEAFELLRKYDADDKEHSTMLISKLKDSDLFNEFLGNPLLVSMLLTAFSYKEEIPRQKHIFYRNVFDALYNAQDLTKGGAYEHDKFSGLLIEDFHKVLRYIGMICLRRGQIEFSKDGLINTIELAIKQCPGISCSAGDFYEDVLKTVPLFIKDGVYYRWAHKSILEYFAAQCIYRDSPDKEHSLRFLCSENKIDECYNVLDLYYEIDYPSFRQYIIRPLFQEFVDYVEKDTVLTDRVLRRRECTFQFDKIIFHISDISKNRSLRFIYSHNDPKLLDLFLEAIIIRNSCRVFDKKHGISLLIRLLSEKSHSCCGSPDKFSHSYISFCDLESGEYYLDETPNNPLNIGERYEESTLVLSRGYPHLLYERVKNELKRIDEDISAAKEFENQIFK